MLEFFSENFSNCVWLAVFIIALIPTLESKIAIPFGMSVQIFGSSALDPYTTCVVALMAGMISSFLVIVLTRKIKSKSTGFLNDKSLNNINIRISKPFEKFSKKTTTLKKCLYLAGFVAIPLPLTGVYTGSLIAGLSSLKFWQGFLSIVAGQIFACAGIILLCCLFENSAFYIFIMGLIIVAFILVLNIIINICSRFTRKRK